MKRSEMIRIVATDYMFNYGDDYSDRAKYRKMAERFLDFFEERDMLPPFYEHEEGLTVCFDPEITGDNKWEPEEK